MTPIFALSIEEINLGKNHFSELIKILFFKQNEDLISLLDIDNDDIFIDPIIYAYFTDAEAESKATLEQLVYGYISTENKPKSINVIFDEDGVLYMPNIGYYKTNDFEVRNKKCNFFYNNGLPEIKYNNQLIEFDFYPLIYADAKNRMEVIQFQHPLLKPYFKVLRPGYANQGSECEVEVNNITNYHLTNLKKALLFIESNFPAIYETIIESNKKIMIFGNQAMLPFTAQNSLGISFISSLYTDSFVFFIEEILHQGSHNLFNFMNYDKQKYFKIDVENSVLGDFIDNPEEKRMIYNVFHGVITITQRLICYQYIIENNLLKGMDLHELTGRYCDQYRRHHAGLEKLDLDTIYTEMGKKLYLEMDNACELSLSYFFETKKIHNVINQPSEFNFQQFLVLNPLKK